MNEDKRLSEVIRVQKRPNNFVMMDRDFLENENLSWKAKGMMAYLLSKPDNWKVIARDLVNHSTDGKGSVYKGLNELKELGYYIKTPVRDEKGVFVRWDSVVLEVPNAESLENSGVYPLPKNPEMDNPEMENPFMENRERNSIDFSNNDFSNIKVSESEPAPTNTQHGEFKQVQLTAEQYDDLIRQYGRDKAIDYINRIDRHMASTGKQYKGHYATVKKWIAEDESKMKQPEPTKPNKFVNFEQRDIDFDELERKEMGYIRREAAKS